MSSRQLCITDDVAWMSVVQIDTFFEEDLMRSLEIYRQSSPEGNETIRDDFDAVQHLVNDPLLCFINLQWTPLLFVFVTAPRSKLIFSYVLNMFYCWYLHTLM